MIESAITPISPDLILPLFGVGDQHLRIVRDTFSVDVTYRDGQIRVKGAEQDVNRATETLIKLKSHVERNAGRLTSQDVGQILAEVTGDIPDGPAKKIDVIYTGKKVLPKTPGQTRYCDTIRDHALTLAVGPAGTGKTYLAVALAVESFKQKLIRKILLCRPAVEAGESLGYLPGDLQAKINPYLRSLLDALREMIDYDQLKRLIEQDVVEVCPLAYMRGRTLNDAFIILDEAQNTTVAQMKMFLTRMGNGSKIVVSGDTTQVDLPTSKKSGLQDAIDRLGHIRGVGKVQLTRDDIVRHSLVQEIVDAYEDPTKPE